MAFRTKVAATLESIFRLGTGRSFLRGLLSGEIESRKADDSGYAIVRGDHPVGPNDLMTRLFGEQAQTQISTWKPPVRVATTGNITLSGLQTIDGVALVAGDRVLVRSQTTASQNGIWVVAAGAWVRATDFSGVTYPVLSKCVTEVQEGALWGGAQFMLVTTGGIVIGTTAITFEEVGAVHRSTSVAQPMNVLSRKGSTSTSPVLATCVGAVNLGCRSTGSTAGVQANYGTISGGDRHEIASGGTYGTIAGGLSCAVRRAYGYAAGQACEVGIAAKTAGGASSVALGSYGRAINDTTMAMGGGGFSNVAGSAQWTRTMLTGATPGSVVNEAVILRPGGTATESYRLELNKGYELIIHVLVKRPEAAGNALISYYQRVLVTVSTAGVVTFVSTTDLLGVVGNLLSPTFLTYQAVNSATDPAFNIVFNTGLLNIMPSRVVCLIESLEVFYA